MCRRCGHKHLVLIDEVTEELELSDCPVCGCEYAIVVLEGGTDAGK